MTSMEVRDRLEIHPFEFRALCAENYIEGKTISVDYREKDILAFSSSAIAAFGDMYFSRIQMRKILPEHLSVDALHQLGLSPAINLRSKPENRPVTFYRKADVFGILGR